MSKSEYRVESPNDHENRFSLITGLIPTRGDSIGEKIDRRRFYSDLPAMLSGLRVQDPIPAEIEQRWQRSGRADND